MGRGRRGDRGGLFSNQMMRRRKRKSHISTSGGGMEGMVEVGRGTPSSPQLQYQPQHRDLLLIPHNRRLELEVEELHFEKEEGEKGGDGRMKN